MARTAYEPVVNIPSLTNASTACQVHRPMTNAKQHHYVPRAYLTAFTAPNTPDGHEPFLWVYERDRGTPFARAPKKVAVERHYYAANLKDGTKQTGVEELLSRVESAAIPVLRRLATGDDPAVVSEDDRAWVAFYVSLQTVRIPRFRTSVEGSMADVMGKVSVMSATHADYFVRAMRDAYHIKGKRRPDDAMIEKARQFILSKEWTLRVDRLSSLQQMVPLAAETAQYAYRMHWRVLEAPPGVQFLTSDAPVVRVSTERQPPLLGLGAGWLTPWMEATLPLSPARCLLMSLHHPEGREHVRAEQVREINRRTAAFASEQVYAATQFSPAVLNVAADWRWWEPVTEALFPPAELGQPPRLPSE